MKLRNQLLTLSLATVLVPWFGFKLVQELEQFLRAGQENTLLASARTVAQALPVEFQTNLRFGREHALPIRELPDRPIVDGYSGDWPEPGSSLEFRSEDGALTLAILAGRYRDELFLFCRVLDTTRVRALPPAGNGERGPPRSDGILLALRSSRGLTNFQIHTAAPGPLLIQSQTEGGGQLDGYWLDRGDGYDVELALPPNVRPVDLSIGVVDVSTGSAGQEVVREAGTMRGGQAAGWLVQSPRLALLDEWLAGVIPPGSRAWVVDANGWVMAETAPVAGAAPRQPTWAERTIYRLVAGSSIALVEERPESVVRFSEPLVAEALQGETSQGWAQDPDSAVVRNTVGVPIVLDGGVRGAVVMEARSDSMLLVTNRALGRLLLTTLLLTVGLAAGLWFLATRLSRRVQRLSGAVSRAMGDFGPARDLPLTADRDELGELARNNARLLRAVADYTSYLQKLAGRLSHELKTPLAITRSSLDNLGSQDLDADSRRYLERAREGLDRQAAIVRAMSEASRLEASVRAADWEEVDLAELLRHCVEAYRSVHEGRKIELRLPDGPLPWRCAPDLIAQALDKLVDNALGLTSEEETVTVSLDIKGNYGHLSVRNTGTTLPDTLTEQLFDSLVSVRQAGDRNLHLGLGLYIVRLVAEAHGGTVAARNLDSGKGVAFTISLPASL
jgi:signal transduction histidine kinase